MFQESVKINDVKLQLAQLVKSYRKRDKLTQQELADCLNLSRVTIKNLESGNNFTIDTLLKILQHFEQLEALNKLISSTIEGNNNTPSFY
jgi:transcriptional regulator with XRE-family HTH domain